MPRIYDLDYMSPPSELTIVTREEWGAKEPLEKGALDVLCSQPLTLPVTVVRFNCTGSRMCTTRKDCSKLLKYCQDNYIDCGHYDILHNFMIGVDGTIYEGRGWNIRPDVVLGKKKDTTLEIAFIGWFMDHDPFRTQLNAARSLINYGIRIQKIAPDHKEMWFRDLFQ